MNPKHYKSDKIVVVKLLLVCILSRNSALKLHTSTLFLMGNLFAILFQQQSLCLAKSITEFEIAFNLIGVTIGNYRRENKNADLRHLHLCLRLCTCENESTGDRQECLSHCIGITQGYKLKNT